MSYSRITDHRSMVFDGLRNAAYARALAKVVAPDTTVMDLGAGLGVHGLNAASLGAAAVHLVEPSSVVEIARTVATANGLANVHCHATRVEELQLAAPVDVIVSVFTGNFLLTEDLLPSLFYARDKFLAPGGHLIPDRARMEVVPVSVPAYYRKHIDAWSAYPAHAAAHGEPELDYSAVRNFAANTLYYDTRENFRATTLSAPASLMEMDFSLATRAECNSEVEVRVDREGTCHGWLGWFQMRLIDEWLSTSGDPQATHWSPVFLPLEQPLQVKAGEQLGFALKRPEFGEWTWTTRHGDTRQRQSTFLSEPVSPERMRRSSDQYQPGLNERGEAARWLLARMAGEVSVSQL
ncbi:MAG: class I SAM-dependent methyltransferase, partial [Halieaceae bacterium]|nr:class I SAM-dependent methyltransferase [Halieaceae bacterium]